MLIYLLIVVNFQSWLDPFVIVSALPTALAGIVWILFLSFTTLLVPALTGAIMCMGVATANSILVVSFARERLAEGAEALTAALDAGFTLTDRYDVTGGDPDACLPQGRPGSVSQPGVHD